jgi:hypothetical protein
MADEHFPLRGNLHAIEHLLGQLYVAMLDQHRDPQGWIERNAADIKAKIMRPNSFDHEEKETAYGTVRRVMEIASMQLEADGRGPKVDLRSEPPRRAEGS